MRQSDKPLHAGNKHLLLDIDDAVVSYGDERVLDGVSFCIHSGEFVGLIGPNGAGKTTLIRVMLGLQSLHHGVMKRSHELVVGYVPQRGSAHDMQVPLSVAEVVGLGSRRAEYCTEALRDVGMLGSAGRRFSELSGGQQQRVLIAKALAARPNMLVLDEPTTGIDEAAQQEFAAILGRLAERGITVVMVSHDIEAVIAQVNRVICLNRRVLYDGSPAKFELETYLPEMYQTQHRALHHHHAIEGDDRRA